MRKLLSLLSVCFCVVAHGQTIYGLPYHITSPGTYTLGGSYFSGVSPAIEISSSNVYLYFNSNSVTAQSPGLTGVYVDSGVQDVYIMGGNLSGFSSPVIVSGDTTWISRMGITLSGYGRAITEYGTGIIVSSSSIAGDGTPGQTGIWNDNTGNQQGFLYFGNLSKIYINSPNPSLNINAGNTALANTITN